MTASAEHLQERFSIECLHITIWNNDIKENIIKLIIILYNEISALNLLLDM